MYYLLSKIITIKRGEDRVEVDLTRDIEGEQIDLILMIHKILLIILGDRSSIMKMILFSKKSLKGKENKLQHQEKKM
jgi:hypothetical protein